MVKYGKNIPQYMFVLYINTIFVLYTNNVVYNGKFE